MLTSAVERLVIRLNRAAHFTVQLTYAYKVRDQPFPSSDTRGTFASRIMRNGLYDACLCRNQL